MNNQITNTAEHQIIKQVVSIWTAQNKVVTDFFSKHPDEVYAKEVAPGRNRAVYLFGHLIAASDGMIPLLGLGERLYPQLEPVFLASPDNTSATMPSIPELKEMWNTVNTKLTNHFNNMQPSDWLDRHTKVSPEDFAKEPHRNKLNILLSRTNHLSYHSGQLNLLGK